MSDNAAQHADEVRIDEAWLYRQIVAKWGEYGAHAEIYRRVAERAGLLIDGADAWERAGVRPRSSVRLSTVGFLPTRRLVPLERDPAQATPVEAQHADYVWVEQTQTVDAVDTTVVRAIEANPGWRLLSVGLGSGGQTTLTYGWPWPGERLNDGRVDG